MFNRLIGYYILLTLYGKARFIACISLANDPFFNAPPRWNIGKLNSDVQRNHE